MMRAFWPPPPWPWPRWWADIHFGRARGVARPETERPPAEPAFAAELDSLYWRTFLDVWPLLGGRRAQRAERETASTDEAA